MAMEIRRDRGMEETILETIKTCQQRQEAPLLWAMEVGKCLVSLGMRLPSPELGHVLVPYLCFDNNHPSLWKFLQQALSSRLLYPIHILSLLSARVIPNRRSQPEAYRLYLELLSRYAFSLDSIGEEACKQKIIKSVDVALQLSHTYRVQVQELGHVLVLFFFSIVVGLIDSTFNDWGLRMKSSDIPSGPFGNADNKDMDVDAWGNYNIGRYEHRELLRKTNSLFAIEVLVKLTESRKAMVLLRIVYLNMPEIFNGLLQRLLFYKANKLVSSNMESANQLLERLSANIQRVYDFEYQLNRHQIIQMLVDIKPSKPISYCNSESGQSSCWVPFDIYMENAMDGKQLHIRPSVAILTETIKTLQVFNRASWQETFLALWLSALRLVQRERDPVEGPIPHLESRLCVLLTIVPLAIAKILEDEASSVQGAGISGCMDRLERQVEGNGQTSRKHELILSLQVLGDFSGLLCPPSSVMGAANNAALMAASFISNSKNTKSGSGDANRTDPSVNAGGNMWHLIVEACIARNLIDVSAYYWPGYVSASVISLVSDLPPVQKSPWLTFMEGAPLNNSLVNSLLTTPAPCLAEIEKLYHIALNGSAEEKSAAAKVLCGASLTRGWNIQEHVVHHVVKLLSPPIPSTHSGQRSHLVDHVPMLSAILFGASTIDNVHILSLHGVIPEVAASLMPLCEAFGSLVPTSSNKSSSGDDPSIYMVFSNAFLFLLRLWKFYRPPLDQWLSEGGAFGGGLTLEYLLLLRNSRIASYNSAASNEINNDSVQFQPTSDKHVYIDFYPKLRAWCCQNKSCVASTVSGLSTGNPVHQVANKILNMIYSKMTKTVSSSGNSSTLSGNSLSGSASSSGEDPYQRPMLPAWEVLEAIPFVLEAVLTACAHGRLSSRDLTTGLRDLIDFLPASIGAIISYFTAEVTRGTWKPVPMKGRMKDFFETQLQIAGICTEIAGTGHSIKPTDPKVNEQDLTLKRLEELKAHLKELQNEKSLRLQKVISNISTIHDLSVVMSIDFFETVNDVHPSLIDSANGQSKSISNDTLARLTGVIHSLKQDKQQRLQKLQVLGRMLIELWNLMDTPIEEQGKWDRITTLSSCSVNEVSRQGSLALEVIEQTEVEVVRLNALKAGKLKDLVFKRQNELEEIYRGCHMDVDSDAARQILIGLIESGNVDLSDLLSSMDDQIRKAKEQALSRKEILDKVEKWKCASEEEKWLDEYEKDENRYSAGRGAHKNLKRAEKARILVCKIPSILENLTAKVKEWELEKGIPFLYDKASLLKTLEEYAVLRQEREEEKRRSREQKRQQEQFVAEQEARYGSRPTVKKPLGQSASANTMAGTPIGRRLATPCLHAISSGKERRESKVLNVTPINYVALPKNDSASRG